jgi:hypothetical protein
MKILVIYKIAQHFTIGKKQSNKNAKSLKILVNRLVFGISK